MSFLDQGPEVVQIWPEVAYTDPRGNSSRRPADDDESVMVRCWVGPVSSEENQTASQVISTMFNIWASELPDGPWAKVRWDGRDWDFHGEVKRFLGFSRTPVAEAVIIARSPRPA